MRKLNKQIILLILSLKEVFSFVTGALISGFFISLITNENHNKDHFIAMRYTIFSGILLFYLIWQSSLHKKCKDLAFFAYRKSSKTSTEISVEADDEFFDDQKHRKFTIPIAFISALFFLVLGWIYLEKGIEFNQQQTKLDKERTLQSIDTLLSERNKKLLLKLENQKTLLLQLDSTIKANSPQPTSKNKPKKKSKK